MFVSLFVDDIDERCQRGRFTTSSWSGDKYKSTLLFRQTKYRIRNSQFLRRRNPVSYNTENCRIGTSLMKSIDTESSDPGIGVGEIDFA